MDKNDADASQPDEGQKRMNDAAVELMKHPEIQKRLRENDIVQEDK